MSDFQLESRSQVKDKQLQFLAKRAAKLLGPDAEQKDIDSMTRNIQELYKDKIGLPLFEARRAERFQLPFMEDMQFNMEEVTADLNVLSDEHQSASLFLKDAFNSVHSEKKRLTQRIDALNSLTGELLLLSGNDTEDTYYIKESFQQADAMDFSFAIDSVSKAAIHTGEGILTLGRSDTINLSDKARVSHLSGNGEAGVNHIARKFATVDKNNQTIEAYQFINEQDKELHTKTDSILDDKPDTLFEYQLVNVPSKFKKDRRYYDFAWANGEQEGERLRLKLVVELDSEQVLNWITFDPYYANTADGKVIMHSIQTSLDGFDYQPLYEGKLELNQTINATPQTYRMDDLFDGQNNPADGQYSGKGVWSFPHRKARFIEFVIDQPQSHPEILGQAVYTMKTDNMTIPVQVPEPEELKNQQAGEYVRSVDGERVIYKKEIQATNQGWRYDIGIRDIKLLQYQFEGKSYFISKQYEIPRGIERLALYAKEIIPESYLDIVSKNNDWIQYEVSFDDIEWYRISPMHHEPLSDDFPPKILEINTPAVDLTKAFQVHKALIKTNDAPKNLRFRVTMTRPSGEEFKNTTPILEELALKIEMKGDL